MNSPKNNVSKTEYWDKRKDKIITDIGKWQGGKDVTIRGYSLFNELFDQVSYFQVLVLNVTGRLISSELSRWLENNFMVMSYPDARIWCNQVGALSGTLHTSPSAATAAGSLTADSRIYGGSQSTCVTMHFIKTAQSNFESGQTVEKIIGKLPVKQGMPAVPGFVRPVASDDERIRPHQNMAAKLGFKKGKYTILADKISDFMENKYTMGMNIDGLSAAFLLDQAFSPEEVYQINSLRVASGVTACYSDNLQHAENSFLPLHCEEIEYDGPSIRKV